MPSGVPGSIHCGLAARNPGNATPSGSTVYLEYIVVGSAAYAAQSLGAPDAQGARLGRHNFRQPSFIAFNRKDGMPVQFMSQALGLKSVHLHQVFVPSCQGMVSAVLAGWGVAVVPRLLVQEPLRQGQLINLMPEHSLKLPLYWHCWNLPSELLDSLSAALQAAAAAVLLPVDQT